MPVALVALLMVLGTPPQSAPRVRGLVVDPAGSPLPGATVAIDAPGATAVTTDADGRFEIAGPTAGRQRVTVTLAGFASSTTWVTFVSPDAAGATRELRVVLLPRAVGETVSVTATRGSGRLEGAAPVSALTPTDLQLAASPALDDLLRTVPGFGLFRRTSSRTANPTAQGASLRGVSASGASRALVLADGAPLNDPFGGWVYWDRVPQAAIDRVEIVRGGASDLYGADALSGVVQVLTRRPEGPGLTATLEASSHATPRASVFAGTAGPGWTASIAGEASRTDGTFVVAPEDRGAVDVRAGSDYLSAVASVGVERPSGWSLRVRADGLGESRENGTPLQVNGTDVRQGRFDATAPLGGGRLEAYGQVGDQVYRQAFSAIAPSRATETLTTRQRVPASQFGYGVTWRRLFGGLDLLAGAETREVVATNEETGYFPDGRVRSFSETHGFQRSTGAFAQVRATIGARTTLVAGARGDLWEPTRGGNGTGVVSPRVSVTHRLSGWLTLRGAFASSFRPPTLNERYRGFRVGNVQTLANPALEPEALTSGEGGALVELSRGTIRTTVFASSLDEAITSVTLSTTPLLTTRRRENAGTVHARGLEAEGEYRVRRSVTLLASLALIRSRFVDTPGLSGNHVPQIPSWQGTGGIRWTAPAAFVVQGQVRAIGDQFEDDLNTLVLRQAVLVDLSTTRRLGRWVGAFAAVENLFDVEYDTGRTPLRTIGMPRTVRAGTRVYVP
jgi:outer membrane receptor protein involved in Fe transport